MKCCQIIGCCKFSWRFQGKTDTIYAADIEETVGEWILWLLLVWGGFCCRVVYWSHTSRPTSCITPKLISIINKHRLTWAKLPGIQQDIGLASRGHWTRTACCYSTRHWTLDRPFGTFNSVALKGTLANSWCHPNLFTLSSWVHGYLPWQIRTSAPYERLPEKCQYRPPLWHTEFKKPMTEIKMPTTGSFLWALSTLLWGSSTLGPF